MNRARMFLVAGFIFFVAGGVTLALGRGTAWTTAGTTLGLAGLGALAWAWYRRTDEPD